MKKVTEILAKTNEVYKLNLTEAQLRGIRTSLRHAGFKDTIPKEDIPLVRTLIQERAKAVTANVYNPLKRRTVVTAQTDVSNCPICQKQMKTVKLHGSREVNYCAEHKVAMPMGE